MGLDLQSVTSNADRRGMRYLVFRVLLTVCGFGLVAVHRYLLAADAETVPATVIYLLLVAYLIFAVLSLVLFFTRQDRATFIRRQVLVDFLFQSALVWMTGGVVSVFIPLVFVTLVAATTMTVARGSFVLATLATAGLTLTVIGYVGGFAPAVLTRDSWLPNGNGPSFVIAYLLASVLGLYAISTLGLFMSHGLRRIEGIQSEILENMAEGIVALDREGRVIQLNRESRNLLGLREDQIGQKAYLRELLDGKEFVELRNAFERGERRRVELAFINFAGKKKQVELKTTTVRDHNGEDRYRIGLIADLTLKKEIEEAERRIQKLEELQVMAMGLAHEIRNPLASIRGCVQELAKTGLESERRSRFMGIIVRESDRLDRIIENFLVYARSGPADLVPMQLAPVVEETLILIRSRSDFGERTLHWNPPEPSPRVFGDRNRLVQVLLNLGINAIEATDPQRGEIWVELRAVRRCPVDRRGGGAEGRNGIELSVRDNGCGMAEEARERLFTPFFTTKETGNGLGLCIVDRIVREHFGEMDVEAAELGGTRVAVWLPAIGDERSSDASEQRAELELATHE